MVKTISLPELVYSELVTIAGELTMRSKKPISLGMAVSILASIYKTFNQCFPEFLEKLAEKLQKANVMSPEEFDKVWEETFKQISGET